MLRGNTDIERQSSLGAPPGQILPNVDAIGIITCCVNVGDEISSGRGRPQVSGRGRQPCLLWSANISIECAYVSRLALFRNRPSDAALSNEWPSPQSSTLARMLHKCLPLIGQH